MYYDKLRQLRKERQLTQEQLGKKLNIATSTISMYENGTREPDIQTLIQMSKFFKVSVDYILELTENRYPSDYSVEEILNDILISLKKDKNSND